MTNQEVLAILNDMKIKLEETIRRLEPEKCSCHERDSSQVCDLCYRNGYRGWMQESGSTKCQGCGLWSETKTCDFCGYFNG